MLNKIHREIALTIPIISSYQRTPLCQGRKQMHSDNSVQFMLDLFFNSATGKKMKVQF